MTEPQGTHVASLIPVRRWRNLWIAQAAIIVVLGLAFRWEPIDDSYISFRYAQNWANGDGLVFNPGERVEGYTNFLWTAMLAGAAVVGLDLPKTAMVLGCALSVLAIALTTMLASHVATERKWSASVPIMSAWILTLHPGWSYWAFSGMEVMLLTCLVLGFLLVGCERNCSPVRLIVAGALGVLMAMTRWESMLLWPIPFVVIGLERSTSARVRLARILSLASVLVVGFGIYFTVRYAYYGELMPNTFYAKAGASVFDRLPKGIRYTGELGVGWMLPATGLAWLWGVRRRWSAVLTATLVIYGGYVTWSGGDAFPWLRFYVPVIPICALLAAGLVERVVMRCRPSVISRLRIAGVAVSIAMFGSIALALDYDSARGHLRWLDGWRYVASWIRTSLPADYRIVSAPIGIIGYYGERRVIDFLGLTDWEIAHEGATDPTEPPGHQRHHIQSILSRGAEVVVGNGAVFSAPPIEPEAIRACLRKRFIQMLNMDAFRGAYRYEVASVEDKYVPYWIRYDLSEIDSTPQDLAVDKKQVPRASDVGER